MRLQESIMIRTCVDALSVTSGGFCLNVGSSTKSYREIDKPHIASELLAPIEARGLRLIHCDLKSAEGVDLTGDVLDAAFRSKLRSYAPALVLCCNLLEHLEDPLEFARTFRDVLEPGGFLIVSVPYSYPMHEDPIDNMLRPTPAEIEAMFPGFVLCRGEIVEAGSYLGDVWHRRSFKQFSRLVLAVMFPFMSKSAWFPKAHRLLWLFRPYRISIAVLQRVAKEQTDSGVQAFHG